MSKRVLGVLAGNDVDPNHLVAWAESADLVIAADGGANSLLNQGIVPDIALGDLDSISAQAKSAQVDLRFDPDQDTTDCDKLLNLAHALGHEEITLIGVEGDLLDHVVGSLQSAAKAKIRVRFVLRRGIGWLLRGPAEHTVLNARERVSLVPLTRCDGVSMEGVQWPLHSAQLDPLGLTSLSNRAKSPPIHVTIESGCAFWFVEGYNAPTW